MKSMTIHRLDGVPVAQAGLVGGGAGVDVFDADGPRHKLRNQAHVGQIELPPLCLPSLVQRERERLSATVHR